MKIEILSQGKMRMTGKKVLKAIMDNYTPPIDLFVREVIQNSADACLPDKTFSKIEFNLSTFKNDSLCSYIPDIEKKLKKFFSNEEYNFISISDSNTCGLLGEANHSKTGPNNLYNLVYDLFNEKDDEFSGGSCGVGKTIYYRYGNGLCFYYSRTFENGEYKSKLAGALIQDQTTDKCFLGPDTSGIAYFGDLDSNNNSIPINDEIEIAKFLRIFGLKPYSEDKTGTVVIIPYVDYTDLLEYNNNNEDDVSRYWLENINDCLEMAIQRWYFPRINNDCFNGKSLRIAINNKKVELCKFYAILQELYNGTLYGCKNIKIDGRGLPNDEALGTFNFKIFDKAELGIHTPPDNFPEPKYFVDSSIDCDKQGLLFYTRKPGMILNYSNREFGSYTIDDGKYLIGIFILNDNYCFNNENLGYYMKKTEKGNHITWGNDNFKDYPNLSSKRPFSKICASIKKYLNDIFKEEKVINIDGGTTILQKKLGEKILPPFDFGTKPSPVVKPSSPGGSISPKKKKINVSFNGANSGLLEYGIDFIVQPKERFKLMLEIRAGNKTYSFNSWEQLSFDFPCLFYRIEISTFWINNSKKDIPQVIQMDENFSKRRKKLLEGKDIYKIQGYSTDGGIPYGFSITNAMQDILKMHMILYIKPINNKYSIDFNTIITKEESKNEKYI